MSERIPVSPLSEDLTAELIDILHHWGDRYELSQGVDEDGWYLRITDRPAEPNGRVFVARSTGEARVMLGGLDQGLP
jgi:hypothetical protein